MAHNLSSPPLVETIGPIQPSDTVLRESPLDSLAHQLSQQYILSEQMAGSALLLQLLQRQEKFLTRAYQHFSGTAQEDITPSYAAEWLLDNFFLVQQAIRQVREDMPPGYYQQLPKLKNTDWANYPRSYALAREVIRYSNCQLNIEETGSFIQAFQANGVTLTMGELWAFPTMLRLGILDSLTNALPHLVQVKEPPVLGTAPVTSSGPVTDDALVGNCITSLRLLAIEDWKTFFEGVCVVEHILRQDPAQVYSTMNFDTRNSYRTAVHGFALLTKQPEAAVAQQAITLSAISPNSGEAHDTSRIAHVGYYFIDS